MQINTKKIDEKILTLSKIHSNFRNRKIDYISFLQGNNIQFPSISNVMMSFPIVQRERNEIKNSTKRKNIIELDRYFENHNNKINQDDINKIIFASPLRNRITFQKTFFKSNLYATVELKKTKNGFRLPPNSKNQRERNSISLDPIKEMQQKEKLTQFKAKLFAEICSKIQKGKTANDDKTEKNPEQLNGPNKKLNMKKQRINKLKLKNKDLHQDRYSPWRSEELEEELML